MGAASKTEKSPMTQTDGLKSKITIVKKMERHPYNAERSNDKILPKILYLAKISISYEGKIKHCYTEKTEINYFWQSCNYKNTKKFFVLKIYDTRCKLGM